jgi:hypothetical protein
MVSAQQKERPRVTERRLQEVVNELKTRLGISSDVTAAIVAHDPRLASVAAPTRDHEPYRLSIERAFVATLTDEELRAAVAHELGHVWVFTNYPYQQTEALANQIAMRIVERAHLEQVYYKVFQRGGTKQDLDSFLGPRPALSAAAATH